MNLKLALATLGVSLLSVTAAFGQSSFPGLSITFNPQQTNVPNFLDYNADFEYVAPAGSALTSIFLFPSGIGDPGLVDPGGYTEFDSGVDADIYPFQLGDLGGGVNTGIRNELVFSLQFDSTAVDTSGGYNFLVYDVNPDPAVNPNATPIGTANARFLADVPGTVVPEPGTVALLVGMGVAGLTLRRRRK